MSNSTLTKPVVAELAKHSGVEVHRGKIRITFTWNGRRRVSLPCADPHKIKVPEIKAAARKRAVVQDEIDRGVFVWEKHFPWVDSPVKSTLPTGNAWTVSQGIEEWLTSIERTTAPCTFRNYKSKALIHVEPALGQMAMTDVTQTTLEAFRNKLIDSRLSVKTINDIFTVVRQVFERSKYVTVNPCANIKNLKRNLKKASKADPFELEELEAMAATETRRQSEKNMIMFACWTGLSISELIALAWEDIDWDNNTLHVRRARVDAEFKVPTKSSQRDRVIEILPPAMEWLKRQRMISGLLPAITEPVRQACNVTIEDESFRPVWVNTDTQRYHPNDWVVSHRFLKAFLKKAKVRYRSANQCRHTFASRALTLGMDPHWVARHMGHGSTEMVRRHYGKIIDKEVPSMADEFMNRLAAVK